MIEYKNEILDLICFITLGLILAQLLVHYLSHIEDGNKYSYIKVIVSFLMLFIVIYISSQIEGRWNRNIFTEFIPIIVIFLTTIAYIAHSRYRRKNRLVREK